MATMNQVFPYRAMVWTIRDLKILFHLQEEEQKHQNTVENSRDTQLRPGGKPGALAPPRGRAAETQNQPEKKLSTRNLHESDSLGKLEM